MRKPAGIFILLLLTSAVCAQPVITSSSPAFCTGRTYVFSLTNTVSSNSSTWSATPSDPVTIERATRDSFFISFKKAGSYTVRYAFQESPSTVLTTTRSVAVYTTAHASFNARLLESGFPAELQLTNFSTSQIRNYWVVDNTERDSSVNLTRLISTSGNHFVKLIAIGKGGCSDTSSYAFYINDSSSLTLPNVFTPNEDGTNDFYRPLARGIRTLHAWIFNRDGLQIAEWLKPNGGWDGRMASGEMCSEGQYFIVLEAEGFDARKYSLKQQITLLR